MSDHKDDDHKDNDRQNNDFDKKISELYQQASQDQPPSHLDDAILAAAKREVGPATLTNVKAKSKVASPFGGRWTLPVSLAAVIVLSVTVVTLIQKESPSEITSTFMDFDAPTAKRAQPAPLAEAESPAMAEAISETPAREEKIARSKKKVQHEAASSEPQSIALAPTTAPAMSLSKQEAAAPQKALPSPVAKAKPSAESRRRSVKPETTTPTIQADAEQKANVLADRNLGLAGTIATDEVTADEAVNQSGNIEQATAETAVSTIAAEPIVSESARVETPSVIMDEQTAEQSRQELKVTAETTRPRPSAQSARGYDQKPSSGATSSTQHIRAFTRQSAQDRCKALPPWQCMQSLRCTLVTTKEKVVTTKNKEMETEARLQCRQAYNRCEQNFTQYKASKESCESKPGCRFVPGTCECPPDQPCDCKDTEPAQCVQQ